MESITIEVNPNPKLSKNGLRQSTWQASRVRVKKARDEAYLLGLAEKPSVWETPDKVRIHVEQFYARSPLDFDGLACIAAPSIDGLIDAGLMVDDNPKHVLEYTLSHTKVSKVADACVRVTVTPVSE